jgi:DNA-binding MarR family transcriptional regulator
MDRVHTDDDPLGRIELTFLLGLAFQLVLREFIERTRAAGWTDLRPVHGLVFQALRGGGTTGTELAERLGVTKQAAGQIVDDLAAKGYLRREPHPEGGRRRLIVLTDHAHQHLSEAGAVLHHLESEIASRLGDPDLTALRADLTRVIRDLAGEDIPPLRPLW